ncbi:hypothetical protein EWM64_g212 [Hericium alpestre]|uniref:Protein kinase domain-containing protein n=1 Tax=Hericium alpestre TaxID=135208 RepID=A0A4Z0ABU6_9AGAM|nr:hypothetical protein EWM64_g212 [Hericium alpestre]
MSLSLLIPSPPDDDSSAMSYDRAILQADDPSTPSAQLIVEQTELVHEGGESDVYKGTLFGESETQVICRLAFSRDARHRMANEARFYTSKLKDLQGVWVPRYYGFYVGNTTFGLTSCLVLSYCGVRIEGELEDLDTSFKTLLVEAVIDLHNADVVHGNLLEDINILNNGGRPVIIDFKDATEEKCQAGVVQIGALQPDEFDFPCEELLDFLTVLKIWKPRNFIYIGSVQHISMMQDPRKLAATAPDWWPWEAAMQEAYRVILLHTKEYYPKRYKAYVARNEKDDDDTAELVEELRCVTSELTHRTSAHTPLSGTNAFDLAKLEIYAIGLEFNDEDACASARLQGARKIKGSAVTLDMAKCFIFLAHNR